jgi:dolichol kinase
MPRLTTRRAALVVGLVACVTFANALRNGWAMDDTPVVRDNPAAHSIGAALAAAFSPYWPAEPNEPSAGLYRPATILSYAVDWAVSGGRPWWFHLMNVVWHAVASALVVVLMAAWLPTAAALAAGLLFAVHPVHVEAVANVVGRAEMLAAVGMLLAVLAARRYRRADGGTRRLWFAITMAAVAFALFSKEVAVVAVVAIAVDHALERPRGRRMGELYLAVLALTLGWVFLWRAVAGSSVAATAAANFRGVSALGRLTTMLPVQLDVVRLLTWPMQLSHDYNPQVVPQRTEFGALALLGLVTATSILALGAACLKRAPAVAFGILVGVATYAPTSNLVFESGIALAERSLYLAALAPAAALGWLVAWSSGRREQRIVLLAAGALGAVFVGRTMTRTPFWLDSRTAVIQGVIQHPESFRNRVRVGRISELTGDSARGLAEYLTAGALFDREPLVADLSVPLALSMGRYRIAVQEARRAHELWPDNPGFIRLLLDALVAAGAGDSARAVARRALASAPRSRAMAQVYADFLAAVEAPAWQRLAAEIRLDWLSFRLSAASDQLDTLPDLLGDSPGGDWCLELETLWPALQALRPSLEVQVRDIARRRDLSCRLPG